MRGEGRKEKICLRMYKYEQSFDWRSWVVRICWTDSIKWWSTLPFQHTLHTAPPQSLDILVCWAFTSKTQNTMVCRAGLASSSSYNTALLSLSLHWTFQSVFKPLNLWRFVRKIFNSNDSKWPLSSFCSLGLSVISFLICINFLLTSLARRLSFFLDSNPVPCLSVFVPGDFLIFTF